MRAGVWVCLCAISSACAPLITRNEVENDKGESVGWEDGIHYCNRLSANASGRANVNFGVGLTFGIVGLGAAGAATVMAGAITKPDFKDRAIEGALPLASAAALLLTKIFFSREKAAAELAAAAHRNAAPSSVADAASLQQCLEATAKWEESREDAAGIAQESVKAPSSDAGVTKPEKK